MSTWVLLRGLAREARHWGEFPAQLQHALGDARIVTPDFPGNGRLHAQASATRVPAMADTVRSQLVEAGCQPPYRLLALSLGAMAAVAWSEQHPEEIESMVLINTSLAPYSPFYQRLRPSSYPTLLGTLFSGSPTRREQRVLQLTSNLKNFQQQQCIVEQWAVYAREYPVSRANFLRQLRAAARFRAVPTTPAVPLLLLASQRDRLVNPACTLVLAERWQCPIRLHPAAGHDLPLDDGAWVTQQIREWLAA